MEIRYFGAEHCKACHEKWPLVEQTAKEFGVAVEYIDVGTEAGLEEARLRGFRTIPALVLLAHEGTVVKYSAVGGLINRPALETFLAYRLP